MTELPGGAARGGFPPTRHSVVADARSESPEVRRRALETIAAAYWKPVYTYLRLRWRLPNEDAQDVAQAFFARAIEREFFERFDPARARLRTWLRVGLDGFVANERKAAGRLKRGGDAQILSLDFDAVERELAHRADPGAVDPDELFHREWVRGLFERAMAALRDDCEARDKRVAFALFVGYDVEGAEDGAASSYAELARRFEIPVTQVTNHLAWARREFRRRVLDELRESTATEAEYRAEARDVLGVDPP